MLRVAEKAKGCAIGASYAFFHIGKMISQISELPLFETMGEGFHEGMLRSDTGPAQR
jgi:hypothetical protein